MAASEACDNNLSANRYMNTLSESLHDIQLYLDENKDVLPTKSEVSVEELFILINKTIDISTVVQDKLNQNANWLTALIQV